MPARYARRLGGEHDEMVSDMAKLSIALRKRLAASASASVPSFSLSRAKPPASKETKSYSDTQKPPTPGNPSPKMARGEPQLGRQTSADPLVASMPPCLPSTSLALEPEEVVFDQLGMAVVNAVGDRQPSCSSFVPRASMESRLAWMSGGTGK
jgi:hypothetical protein